MNSAGGEFLAGAGLAVDENSGLAAGEPFDLRHEVPKLEGLAQKVEPGIYRSRRWSAFHSLSGKHMGQPVRRIRRLR